MPNGGDILISLSRETSKPTEWDLTYRFRYNERKDGTPWDEGLTFTWQRP